MSVKKVAVIGLGDISGIYLKNIARVFKILNCTGSAPIVWSAPARPQRSMALPGFMKPWNRRLLTRRLTSSSTLLARWSILTSP